MDRSFRGRDGRIPRLLLCILAAWAWPRAAGAHRLLNDSRVVNFGTPDVDGVQRGFYVPLSPVALVHAGFGMATPLYPRQDPPSNPPQPLDNSTVRPIYHIEIGGGAQLGWNRWGSAERGGFLLTPQIGYTFQADNDRYTHLGRLGAAVGYGNQWAQIAYLPRFVAGVAGDRFTVGLRHGVVAYFVANLLAVEVGHQLLHVSDHLEHSLHFTVNVNALLVVLALAYMR